MRRLNYWQALLIAVAVGAAFSFATVYLVRHGGLADTWSMAGVSLVSGLAQVIPGILTGYLVGRRGFLFGSITGLLTFLVGLAISIDFRFSLLGRDHLVLLLGVFSPVVVGAVSGGAGEFLRGKGAV